jgi:hypothetical protein
MGISPVMNFIILLPVLIVRKVQLGKEDVYAILDISYVKSYNIKIVDTGAF